jgi:hypothetical protein
MAMTYLIVHQSIELLTIKFNNIGSKMTLVEHPGDKEVLVLLAVYSLLLSGDLQVSVFFHVYMALHGLMIKVQIDPKKYLFLLL